MKTTLTFTRCLVTFLFAFVCTIGCSSSGDSAPAGGIGDRCDDGHACGPNLFCFAKPGSVLAGICTENCTASDSADSCKNSDPNTACLEAGVCGRECGNGLACPTGTKCGQEQICVHE